MIAHLIDQGFGVIMLKPLLDGAETAEGSVAVWLDGVVESRAGRLRKIEAPRSPWGRNRVRDNVSVCKRVRARSIFGLGGSTSYALFYAEIELSSLIA